MGSRAQRSNTKSHFLIWRILLRKETNLRWLLCVTVCLLLVVVCGIDVGRTKAQTIHALAQGVKNESAQKRSEGRMKSGLHKRSVPRNTTLAGIISGDFRLFMMKA